MKCPNCINVSLLPKLLEKDLKSLHCESCEGRWIPSSWYEDWLQYHKDDVSGQAFSDVNLDVKDAKQAKLCPECRRILVRYKVGHGVDFGLDHCGGCNGVWLDKNEWESLKLRDLHDELNKIFTVPWQQSIFEEEQRNALDKLYRSKFGDDDYAKAKEVKAWLDSHQSKQALLAFLMD